MENTDKINSLSIIQDEEQNWQQNLVDLIHKYLRVCEENKEFPHKAGFRKYIRVNHPTFLRDKIKFDIVTNAIKELEDQGLDFLIQHGLKNRLNSSIVNRLLGSQYGIVDKSEVENKGKVIIAIPSELMVKNDITSNTKASSEGQP